MQEIILKGCDEKILTETLDNGLQVYMLVNEKVNNFYMTLSVKYGSVDTEYECKGEKEYRQVHNGVAHFLEHVNFNEGEGLTAHDYFNKLGSSINAFTTFDFTLYEVFASSEFTSNLNHLLDYVQTPYFTKDLIEKEKGIICEEVKMGKNNPGHKLYYGMNNALFKNDKRKNLVTGEIEDVKATTVFELQDIYEIIEKAIVEDPPMTIKDGGIIKLGYDEEIDKLKTAQTEGKNWLIQLEAEEKEKTGIKNLKIGFNKVFGYYLEVTKSYLNQVPERFIRKQTLTNAERYITEELKNLENQILGAEEKVVNLEYNAFVEIRELIAKNVRRLQTTSEVISSLDVIASFAQVAEDMNYCMPKVDTTGTIDIKNGRHPVIEKILGTGGFVENDTYLDKDDNRLSIITGPNMAGKSTYMRQSALIVLMAQLGSFVPAKSANIGIVDRIFTRVGASDDLASGQSTFMVEMNEVANILRNATPKSLLVLDEIGRGTSTFDGLSIAWAVIEHISNKKILGAKTLFATHYHELTELEGKMSNVNNYCIAVKEKGDDIIFLRKIIKGGADRSYGIQVAKLAGVPDLVIDRAKEIAEQLCDNDITEKVQCIAVDTKSEKKKPEHYDDVDLGQMSLFDTVKDEDILNELQEINISNLTPLDALNTLYRLQNKLKNRW